MNVGRYYTIVLEGIDKTGKDTIARYIDQYCGHVYCIPRRGIVSNIAYAKLFGREIPEYDVENHKNEVYVLLRASSKADWQMRCRLTNEPKIDYESNVAVFEETWEWLKSTGKVYTLEYDTSVMTPHQIAGSIVAEMETFNRGR